MKKKLKGGLNKKMKKFYEAIRKLTNRAGQVYDRVKERTCARFSPGALTLGLIKAVSGDTTSGEDFEVISREPETKDLGRGPSFIFEKSNFLEDPNLYKKIWERNPVFERYHNK